MNIMARNGDEEVGVVPGGQVLGCSPWKFDEFIRWYIQ